MSIKDILDKHNQKEELSKEIIEEQRFQDSEERAKNFINNVITPAFQTLKTEFENYGASRKASLEIRPDSFFASISIFDETLKEFYYELNLRVNEVDFWVKVVYHNIKKNGTFNYLPEQDLNLRKPLLDLNEEDLRADFYQKYDQYMVLKGQNL